MSVTRVTKSVTCVLRGHIFLCDAFFWHESGDWRDHSRAADVGDEIGHLPLAYFGRYCQNAETDTHMFGTTLSDSLVTLAPLEPKHLENYCHWFADPEVVRYMKIQAPPTLADEQVWFERTAHSDRDVVWGLFVDGQHIGSTGIHRIDWRNRHAQTGIAIGDRAFWGRGIATRSHALRTRYAFEQLNLEKLVTTVIEGNTASRRALERAGYVTVGVFRHHEYRNGRWHDTWIGELLREDWMRGQPAT